MDRQMMLKVLVPVGGLAVLLLIVGVVIAVANMESTPGTGSAAVAPGPSGRDRPPAPPPPPRSDAEKFTFALDGPEWKDIGGGLKIWDVKEGDGPLCPPGATVMAHYYGWLTNGFRFDFSRRHGSDPVKFSLNGVVAGWKQGIPGMKGNGIRRLYIPAAMGYGAAGQPPDIPPNSDLVFEVELLGIK